ncbi:hypothetical protein OPKNFCMD_5707 [Methylobacterium crusticola]|uniref:Pesticin C-terminal domain-containing protein n=1 Tax=Methylobacterium crusticola TaxID=1697972 RepID=A0ABQ4R813_9HYPH|nr:hypothetical protein [Methylobacterium crusticola]GJD52939.1 hypothetical protein OPKNFCMD_5707 [Methylobacterium crusticola]
MSDDQANPDTLTEDELESARAAREALEWLRGEHGDAVAGEEGAAEALPPADISPAAFDLIVTFEVTSRALYEDRYRRPTWPGGESGATIGIGYDVGYAQGRLEPDWSGVIPDPMIADLRQALGVTGDDARALAARLGTTVDVPWDAAIAVHRTKVVPRWTQVVTRALPHTDRIGPDCLGALVSLTYNRGATFRKDGDRYREMRAIRQHMEAAEFDLVPGDIRAMARLWPNVAGLRKRREREAALFEAGLAAA